VFHVVLSVYIVYYQYRSVCLTLGLFLVVYLPPRKEEVNGFAHVHLSGKSHVGL